MVDRPDVERLSSNISGFGHGHDVSLPSPRSTSPGYRCMA
jgi:hypothetical protein